MEETRINTINAIINSADYVNSNVPVDYDYALTRLLQLRENLEASSCHLEDAVRAKFDEVEHLIRQIGNISEIQPCLLDLQRDQLQLQISFGIPRREIARRFGVSLKTLHRRIALWGLKGMVQVSIFFFSGNFLVGNKHLNNYPLYLML